jgi:hypothetical protein
MIEPHADSFPIEPYEYDESLDKLNWVLCTSWELVDEMLAAMKTRPGSWAEEQGVWDHADCLVELKIRLNDVCLAVDFCDEVELLEDPLGLLEKMDLLASDVELLIDEGRGLLDHVPDSEPNLASELRQAIAGLSESTRFLTTFVRECW